MEPNKKRPRTSVKYKGISEVLRPLFKLTHEPIYTTPTIPPSPSSPPSPPPNNNSNTTATCFNVSYVPHDPHRALVTDDTQPTKPHIKLVDGRFLTLGDTLERPLEIRLVNETVNGRSSGPLVLRVLEKKPSSSYWERTNTVIQTAPVSKSSGDLPPWVGGYPASSVEPQFFINAPYMVVGGPPPPPTQPSQSGIQQPTSFELPSSRSSTTSQSSPSASRTSSKHPESNVPAAENSAVTQTTNVLKGSSAAEYKETNVLPPPTQLEKVGPGSSTNQSPSSSKSDSSSLQPHSSTPYGLLIGSLAQATPATPIKNLPIASQTTTTPPPPPTSSFLSSSPALSTPATVPSNSRSHQRGGRKSKLTQQNQTQQLPSTQRVPSPASGQSLCTVPTNTANLIASLGSESLKEAAPSLHSSAVLQSPFATQTTTSTSSSLSLSSHTPPLPLPLPPPPPSTAMPSPSRNVNQVPTPNPVMSAHAVRVWRAMTQKVPNSTEVSWQDVCDYANANFSIDLSNFKQLACGDKNTVSLQRWLSLVCCWFTCEDVTSFTIDQTILAFWEKTPWFHGFVGKNQAERIIKKAPAPATLLRCSQTAYGLYVIDMHCPTGVFHSRIARHTKSDWWVWVGENTPHLAAIPADIEWNSGYYLVADDSTLYPQTTKPTLEALVLETILPKIGGSTVTMCPRAPSSVATSKKVESANEEGDPESNKTSS
ncbi:hypothetical protein Pelo_13191 [Pelomyxa schiedti]|nr:hypothetical protein Pelo_13191 [Pelomyxa schiedti]